MISVLRRQNMISLWRCALALKRCSLCFERLAWQNFEWKWSHACVRCMKHTVLIIKQSRFEKSCLTVNFSWRIYQWPYCVNWKKHKLTRFYTLYISWIIWTNKNILFSYHSHWERKKKNKKIVLIRKNTAELFKFWYISKQSGCSPMLYRRHSVWYVAVTTFAHTLLPALIIMYLSLSLLFSSHLPRAWIDGKRTMVYLPLFVMIIFTEYPPFPLAVIEVFALIRLTRIFISLIPRSL